MTKPKKPIGKSLNDTSTSVTLRVIPEPKPGTRSVLVGNKHQPDFVFMVGPSQLSGVSHLCGGCGAKLTDHLPKGSSMSAVVFVCPKCGVYNDTDGAPS